MNEYSIFNVSFVFFVSILCCSILVIVFKLYKQIRDTFNYNRGLYIKISPIPGAGRGVFTDRIIEPNDIVEICPTLTVSKDDIIGTPLHHYAFDNMDEHEKAIVVLGYGSLYNHSANPNCSHTINCADNKMVITSKRRIVKNEELFINYGPQWWESRVLQQP